ncbi:MAG TPA: universal stress protein [Gaiellaceae bacterium]|nr:universal stress protein [Gaiellaceae bacterium]
MFDTIVWATDGSELADGALPIVKELARTHDSRVVALHADALLTGRFGGAPMLADEDDLRVKLREQVAELRREGFDAELLIKVSPMLSPAQIVVETARELDADLIVVATHAYGIVGSLFFGSVAKSLVHEAPCAVLTIPPETAHAAYDAEHDAATVA